MKDKTTTSFLESLLAGITTVQFGLEFLPFGMNSKEKDVLLSDVETALHEMKAAKASIKSAIEKSKSIK